MRLLVLVISLALAAGAMAEGKPKPKSTAKQLDKATPILATTADDGDADNAGDTSEAADAKEKANKTKTRAQDYNSSRSNTTALKGGPESDTGNLGRSRSAERNKGQQGDIASEGKRRGKAQDYNSSRSNISTAVGNDLGKENRCSIGTLDCDDDGDSVPANERCGNGVDDDCDSIDEKDAPANHNTTRSNRTQPVDDGDDPVVSKRPGKKQ